MLRPLATIEAANLGGFEILYENSGISAESRFGINALFDVGYVEALNFLNFSMGPIFNLTGSGFKGIYLGAYPGLLWLGGRDYYFTALTELGYQRIDGNVAWGGTLGFYYNTAINSISLNWGIKIGYVPKLQLEE